MLHWQSMSEYSDTYHSQIMTSFIETKRFKVGPWPLWIGLPRQSLFVENGNKFNVLRLPQRLALFDEFLKWISNPRHLHRPRFHTPESIGSLFKRSELEKIFEIKCERLLDISCDFNFPGRRFKASGHLPNTILDRRKFVKVIIGRIESHL